MKPTPPIRKRMKRQGSVGDARFLTFSCHDRLPLLNHDGIRQIFVDSMVEAREQFGFNLFAWVLMPEHVHLLMSPSEGCSIERALLGIKLSVARQVIDRWEVLRAPILDRITMPHGKRRYWMHGGGFDRKVRDAEAFAKHASYIHQNPVTRGLVARPEDWRWSSVRWWLGRRDGEVVCDEPPGPPGSWTNWKGYI